MNALHCCSGQTRAATARMRWRAWLMRCAVDSILRLMAIAVSAWSLSAVTAHAQTAALADQPPLASYNVPGNLALVLSVEFPTAVSVAYGNRIYVPKTQYIGYFDPAKCYVYVYNSIDSTSSPNVSSPASYFAPNGLATSGHLCNVASTPSNRTNQWSGNYLNWAMTQTIDAFRWVLTGGYRLIDTPSATVLEKAWHTGDGNITDYPDSVLAAGDVAGATPFGDVATLSVGSRIQALGNRMRFYVQQKKPLYRATYYNNTTLTPPAVLTRSENGTDAIQNNTSPGPGVNAAPFSAEYTATFYVPITGNYYFQTNSDDGVRLYINGTKVIDNWTDHSATINQSTAVPLVAGTVLSLVLDYYQSGGDAVLSLQWQTPQSTAFTELMPSSAALYGSSQPYTVKPFSPQGLSSIGTVAETAYDVFTRVKACDTTSSVALEADCTSYGAYAKPEGLLQKYNQKLRYSTFGYLNDNSILRDGGVLRAQQKFIGPVSPTYGFSTAVNNPANEWDPLTGVMVRNPDTADASATFDSNGASVLDSGVLNYINKFGELCLPLGSASCGHSYKTYDPVSELYYAAIRYYKAVGNVPEWSSYSGNQADGFPVITNWKDPIGANWCQKNFILGIGDVNTHADKNVTGATPNAQEPSKPQAVLDDTNSSRSPTDAVTATNQVGLMEFNNAKLGTVNPYNGCCDHNSALMAGLAYDSHTTDIRNDITKPTGSRVSVDTYWVDVQEAQTYSKSNQFWLAAKYGGFTVPTGFDPYSKTATIASSAWWNQVDTDPTTGQARPNNYYPGGRPDLMQSGLTKAFADIASKAGGTSSSSLATPLPQTSSSGSANYSASYDSSTWTGDVLGSSESFATGLPVPTPGGDFAQNLALQTPSSRRIATWNPATGTGVQFEATASGGGTAVSAAQLAALDTSYVPGNDSAAYLSYLRGDRSQEQTAAGDGTHPYRYRASLVGDIVDSKPTAVGPPSFPYADASNPGYSAFKTASAQANRPTVVYVGANDGMLHAIDGALAAPTASNPGNELFAYVPNAVFQGPNNTPNVDGLASLGNPNFAHHYMVNATAYNFDVDFGRTTDGSVAPPTSWTPDWHTVLIGGLGKGGRAMYALDITNPTSMAASEAVLASKVLWEFSSANYLGYTFGEPSVVKTQKYGWVVVLPSGYNNGDGVGHVLFLNPKTGALLETVTMPAGSAGLAHINPWIVDGSDGTADAIYAGDLQGNVWRVDVTAAYSSAGAAYPAPVQLAKLTAASQPTKPVPTDPTYAGQPVTTRPAVAVDPTTGKRFVMVGTGRLLDSSDIGTSASQGQSFYALIDGTNGAFSSTAATGVTFPINRSQLANDTAVTVGTGTAVPQQAAGWFIDLTADVPASGVAGPPIRVLSDATTSYGSVSFVATQPSGSACSPGGVSQLYAVNFGTASSILVNNTGALVSYVWTGVNVTEAKFVSQNGTQTLLYGANGAVTQASILPTSGIPTKRVNWREVPTAD